MSLSCKRPGRGCRAQFQLWIFSYTVLARPSKKWVSRLKIGRGDGLSIVARMERSGMREYRPRISLRSIRATNLDSLRASRPPPGALRFAQRVVAVRARRQLAGMDHAMQSNDERAPLHVELRLVEMVDDLLHRQAERVLGQDVEDEVLDVLRPAAARGDQQRPRALAGRRRLHRRKRRRIGLHGVFEAFGNGRQERGGAAGIG